MQWNAKLYLHNTPHCIAAYLGALTRKQFVHEAMAEPRIYEIVNGAMHEMLSAVRQNWGYPSDFLNWYAAKELARFSDPQLFDPITRVAREPLRKLERRGRLVGAAQLCLAVGIVPHSILLGTTSALLFENKLDPDHHISFLRRSLSTSEFLTHILGLRMGEPFEMLMSREFERLTLKLKELVVSCVLDISPQSLNQVQL